MTRIDAEEPPAREYVAFISYSHADGSVASMIHRWLESYRVPRKLVGRATSVGRVPHSLVPVFRDREELPTSDDLGAQIKTALERSRALVVICSPRSARSRWVNEEILTYKRLGKSRIMCVIVDGEPNALDRGRPDDECFAPALRFNLARGGNLSDVRTEPIAADMREGKDGKRDALLKLVAGIVDVGFDELKQRHKHRALVSRSCYAAGAVVAAIVLGVSAWTYAESRLQRAQAIEAKQAARERERAANEQTRMATLLLGQYLEAARQKIETQIGSVLKDSRDEIPLGEGGEKVAVGIRYRVDVGEITGLSPQAPGSEYALRGSVPVSVSVEIALGPPDEPGRTVTVEKKILSFSCAATYSATNATWDIDIPERMAGIPDALAQVQDMARGVVEQYLSKLEDE